MASTPKSALPHDSKGPWLVATTWGVTGLATVFVVLRFYCRIFRSRSFALDDQVILWAWALLIAQTALTTYNVGLGMGQHIYDVNPMHGSNLLMVSDFATAVAVMAVAFSKASAGISLLRLLQNWWQRLVVQVIIVTTVLFMMGVAILTFVQCDPVRKRWYPQTPGTCRSPNVVLQFSFVAAIYSGVMDILLSIIPWPVIMGLRMSKREKLGVAIALASMVYAGIASFAKATALETLNSTDPTYEVPRLIVLGTIEIAVTIIATCIPVLRVLVRDVQKTYRRRGNDSHWTQPDKRRGSNSSSTAGGSRLGSQLWKGPEDVRVLMPGTKPVVVQEKSWTVTYSPASEIAPILNYPGATTLPRAVEARGSAWFLPSRLSTPFRLAESPVSPSSTPAWPPRAPPSARRHTIDWRNHLNLIPTAAIIDDDLSWGRGHGEDEKTNSWV